MDTVTALKLTDHVRALHLEGKTDAAMRTLSTLQGMTRGQMLDVIEGRSRLTGDSSVGVGLEPDDVKMPSLEEQTLTLRQALEDEKDKAADFVAMAIGDTVALSSPTGKRLVPRRKTRAGRDGFPVLADGYSWEEHVQPGEKPVTVYQQADDMPTKKRKRLEATASNFPDIVEDDVDDEEPAPPPKATRKSKGKKKAPPPPEVCDTITSDTGWLSPEGKFYPTKYAQHRYLAEYLAGVGGEKILEDLGWVRMNTFGPGEQNFFGFVGDVKARPTDIQKKLVRDFCKTHGYEHPFWMRKDY